jgi:hypothetical protein
MTEKDRHFADGSGGWEGAKSYDGKKAWSSIIHSILSAKHYYRLLLFVKKYVKFSLIFVPFGVIVLCMKKRQFLNMFAGPSFKNKEQFCFVKK